MASDNILRNVSTEVTRECQAAGVVIEHELVFYIAEMMLLNPQYGKLFAGVLNRNKLDYFINECCTLILSGGPSLTTLKTQFVFLTNYADSLEAISSRHGLQVKKCLNPLVEEILSADPDFDDQAQSKKLLRKISIYILLSTGLGNPGLVANLKEGMAALESVFKEEELQLWCSYPREEKKKKLKEIKQIVAGVRLFNRDCNKGGEGINDLPLDLVDSGKACVSMLSNNLRSVMQRINMLTVAIDHLVELDYETGNVIVAVPSDLDVTEYECRHLMQLLIFNRQCEIYMRRLLNDAEHCLQFANVLAENYRKVLVEVHGVVSYRTAVACDTVFPMFKSLWECWHSMQSIMFVVSTINRMLNFLVTVQDHMKVPIRVQELLVGKRKIITDQDRMLKQVDREESNASYLESLDCIVKIRPSDSMLNVKVQKQIELLGFCAVCLCQGALVASNLRLGQVVWRGRRYGFCTSNMAALFGKNPQRYINTVYEFVRTHPELINLLGLRTQLEEVRNIDQLVDKLVAKVPVSNKEVQTELHPIPKYIDKDYSWNLWEHRRMARKLTNIQNCRTRSTQTYNSHYRSEICNQTNLQQDKLVQTNREVGVVTSNRCNYYSWGLRGQKNGGQHLMGIQLPIGENKLKPKTLTACAEREFLNHAEDKNGEYHVNEDVSEITQSLESIDMSKKDV